MILPESFARFWQEDAAYYAQHALLDMERGNWDSAREFQLIAARCYARARRILKLES